MSLRAVPSARGEHAPEGARTSACPTPARAQARDRARQAHPPRSSSTLCLPPCLTAGQPSDLSSRFGGKKKWRSVFFNLVNIFFVKKFVGPWLFPVAQRAGLESSAARCSTRCWTRCCPTRCTGRRYPALWVSAGPAWADARRAATALPAARCYRRACLRGAGLCACLWLWRHAAGGARGVRGGDSRSAGRRRRNLTSRAKRRHDGPERHGAAAQRRRDLCFGQDVHVGHGAAEDQVLGRHQADGVGNGGERASRQRVSLSVARASLRVAPPDADWPASDTAQGLAQNYP